MNDMIILTTKEDLYSVIETAFIEKMKKATTLPKLYTVNKVAKMFGVAHLTVKRLVESGIIRSTIDGKITEAALNEYLQR